MMKPRMMLRRPVSAETKLARFYNHASERHNLKPAVFAFLGSVNGQNTEWQKIIQIQ